MLKIKIDDKNILRLRTQIASGKLGKSKFYVAMNIDNKAILFEFPEATYTVHIKDLTEEVIAFRKKHLKKGE